MLPCVDLNIAKNRDAYCFYQLNKSPCLDEDKKILIEKRSPLRCIQTQ